MSTIAGAAFLSPATNAAPIHDTDISLVMQHGPVHKQSLADLHKGKVPKP
jgi:hypothetical protein